MSRTRLKTRLYAELSRIGKALASPPRIELLELLAQGERTVEALADEIHQSVANTSHHLQVLRAARLVDARKEGLFVFYRLGGPEVFDLTRGMRTVAERRYQEVASLTRAYLAHRDELEPITRDELLTRAKDGSAVVLDVRPALEYQAGHIAGAISIPVTDLGSRLAELPRRREIVAYCRGPYCVMAFDAIDILRRAGRRVRRLEDGFPEWRAAGLPVEPYQGRA